MGPKPYQRQETVKITMAVADSDEVAR
jgi:hypothetical protein